MATERKISGRPLHPVKMLSRVFHVLATGIAPMAKQSHHNFKFNEHIRKEKSSIALHAFDYILPLIIAAMALAIGMFWF
jgi:hypothetical protein